MRHRVAVSFPRTCADIESCVCRTHSRLTFDNCPCLAGLAVITNGRTFAFIRIFTHTNILEHMFVSCQPPKGTNFPPKAPSPPHPLHYVNSSHPLPPASLPFPIAYGLLTADSSPDNRFPKKGYQESLSNIISTRFAASSRSQALRGALQQADQRRGKQKDRKIKPEPRLSEDSINHGIRRVVSHAHI